jgi:GAF domain-containing protein
LTIIEWREPGLLDEARVQLADATSLEQVQAIVRTAARRCAEADGATLVLREGDECFYADEDAMSPLWKGQRFPLQDCISGWAMLHKEPAIIPNIRVDERIPQEAYRPTFVHSLVMVPVGVEDPIGAIGAYWAHPRRASAAHADRLAELAAMTAPVLASFLPEERVSA